MYVYVHVYVCVHVYVSVCMCARPLGCFVVQLQIDILG